MAINDADVDIINEALSQIGCDEILTITDDSREARHANRTYETDRDAYLQSKTWNFATGQEELARLQDTPLFGFSYAFQLPSDLLRIQKINQQALRYEIKGRTIYCNAAQVLVEGLFDIGAENYPSYFRKALVMKLAAAYALAILEDPDKHQMWLNAFVRENQSARFIDSQQHSPKRMSQAAFVLVNVRG